MFYTEVRRPSKPRIEFTIKRRKPNTGGLVCFFSVKLVCETHHWAVSHTTEWAFHPSLSHNICNETDWNIFSLFFVLRSHTHTKKDSFKVFFFSSHSFKNLKRFCRVSQSLSSSITLLLLLCSSSICDQCLLGDLLTSSLSIRRYYSLTFGMQLYFLKPSAATELQHQNSSCALKGMFDDVCGWCSVFFFFLNKWGIFFSSDD